MNAFDLFLLLGFLLKSECLLKVLLHGRIKRFTAVTDYVNTFLPPFIDICIRFSQWILDTEYQDPVSKL